MALLIITTILWAFSFSFYGEYLAGHVDSYFAVLVRVGLAALVFLPFLRTRGNSLKTVGLYMLVGAMQLGVMYMLSFRAYLYLTVSELLLFTVLTPLYITLIYCITIVGIPVGVQCFKLASLSFFPFGKEVIYGGGAGSLILNIIWLVVSGLPLALEHLAIGIVLCVTIIGIPFGMQQFKLAKLALMPFGTELH